MEKKCEKNSSKAYTTIKGKYIIYVYLLLGTILDSKYNNIFRKEIKMEWR